MSANSDKTKAEKHKSFCIGFAKGLGEALSVNRGHKIAAVETNEGAPLLLCLSCGAFAVTRPEKLKKPCRGECSAAGKRALHRTLHLSMHPDHQKGNLKIKNCIPLVHDPGLVGHIASLAATKVTFSAKPKVAISGVLRQEYLDAPASLSAAQAKLQALRARLRPTVE